MSDAPSEDCLAGWCADDDWCAITCTADVVGRKWHPVVVARLLDDGPMGFATLAESIAEVSNTVLSDSLEDLEDSGVVDRRIVSERPLRVEYALTPRGESLEPVIDAMAAWGRSEHAPG
ncbi:winged helix-turn-helix transcriptional regulator [Halorientalis pallida]|uniref:winged helix-turn-helix transcriptional regulator n=1 Tax=Halorientalis pallida TaxID=2479928 RepID=UPI003C6FD10D